MHQLHSTIMGRLVTIIIIIIPIVFLTGVRVSCFTCGPHEYLTDQGICCRMCKAELGLKVKRACSPTSDTLCEPLEGHWCTDPIKDGCRKAVEHTKCSPGQYVKQKGTASSDAICGAWTHGKFSDGSLTSSWSKHDCNYTRAGVILTIVSFIASLIFTYVDRSHPRNLKPLIYTQICMVLCGLLCIYVCGLHYFYVTICVIGCVGLCVCVCGTELCGQDFIFANRKGKISVIDLEPKSTTKCDSVITVVAI